MTPTPWFDVEPIDERTFALREPGHWEEPNVYLFVGSRRAALIDTGLGIAPIRPIVERLTDRPVTVVTTHAHWDHIGGHGEFADLCVHERDADWLEHGLPLPDASIRDLLMRKRFRRPVPPAFDSETYMTFRGRPTRVLRDRETIDLGDRFLQTLHTPGHSLGHICLFEPESGFLCTGDLLYRGTVYADYPSTDPRALRDSYERLRALDGVRRILPGHNTLDVPVLWIAKARRALERLADDNLLRHGTGVHRVSGCDLSFRF